MTDLNGTYNSNLAVVARGVIQPVEVLLPEPLVVNNTSWRFLSNYSQVLRLIAADPETRMRDLAERVGITERAIHRIVDDLAQAGYLKILKTGRRNRYEVQAEARLRHPAEAHRNIGELIRFVGPRR